jgi:hypothetical protein
VTLQKLFDRYNRRFWNGKLSGWTAVEVHLCEASGFHGEYGATDMEYRHIHIQIGLSPAEKRKTLLHEMCHAATPEDEIHGPSWQTEMLRIAKLGALGMAAEVRRYEAKYRKLERKAKAKGLSVSEFLRDCGKD